MTSLRTCRQVGAALALVAAVLLTGADVAAADITVPCGTDVALGQPSAQAGTGLVSALLTLYRAPGSIQTLSLTTGCVYLIPAPPTSGSSAATTPFYWYGPSGLPAIDGDITIDGNGATLLRQSTEAPFRFFFVGADPTDAGTTGYSSPGAGSLTLTQLTLQGGLAHGGNGDGGGSGGGFGGAIFNQGSLTLQQTTFTQDQAVGGDGHGGGGGGGGGIGQDATHTAAGGFGPGDFGGPGGGSGSTTGGGAGGGGGFAAGERGHNGANTAGGDGGGTASGLGGAGFTGIGGAPGTAAGTGGDGSGGGGWAQDPGGSTGGAFGEPGTPGNAGGAVGAAGGGGGVGGGGGNYDGAQGTGGGGFGAGGGDDADGGFGGGGGAAYRESVGGVGGFGAGHGGASTSGPQFTQGGGGTGMGGAVFNFQGTVLVRNSTFAANTAKGGAVAATSSATAGQGYGGALLNLNGTLTVVEATIDGNTADHGGGVYDLVYDSATTRHANVTLTDTIVSGSVGASDVTANDPGTTAAGANKGSAAITLSATNVVETQSAQNDATITGTAIASDPKLGALVYSGGLGMKVEVPASTSPAILTGTCPRPADEIGNARPRTAANISCNVGAVELADAPDCTDVTITVPENTATPVSLDCGSGGVGYRTPGTPGHGALSGFSQYTGAVVYTPTGNYVGGDSFTFGAFGVGGSSNTATVHITVVPPAPTCSDVNVTATAGVGKPIQLTCAGQAFAYDTPGSPAHGALSGFSPANGTLTYTATSGSSGSDSFTFTARNAGGTSNTATVHVTVNPPAPVCTDVSASIAYDTATTVQLACTGQSPVYDAPGGPAHGSLSSLPPATGALTYTPTSGFIGTDSFTFTAHNAGGTSNTATVHLTVKPPIPACADMNLTVTAGVATALQLTCTGTTFTYDIPGAPGHGALTGFSAAGGTVTYTAPAGYQGGDSFTFAATSAGGTSPAATVHVTVLPVAPTCTGFSVSVPYETATPVPLTCSGQTLTYPTPGAPGHGTLNGVSPTSGVVTYTPPAGYSGSDSFTFTAQNAGGTSNVATVTVDVQPPAIVHVTVTAASPPTAQQLALDCAHARLVLTNVLPTTGHRVQLTGAADPTFAGQKAQVLRDRTHPAGTLAIKADGSFAGTVSAPPARDVKLARYAVKVGRDASPSLKLDRRMVLKPPALSGGMVRIAGHVVGPLPKTAQRVVVKRATSCNGFATVATVTAKRDGSFTLLAPLPPAPYRAAFYRAQTLVPTHAGGSARNSTFTLPLPVGR